MSFRARHFASSLAFALSLCLAGCSDDGTGPDIPEADAHLLFSSVSAGWMHTCGVRHDGTLLCWGNNGDGQVGDGSYEVRRVPLPISASTDYETVSVGNRHSCALTPEGIAHCWGGNEAGQLGIGSSDWRVPVPSMVAGSLRFSSITAGPGHTCALDENGAAFCWGASRGALGAGSQTLQDCNSYPCARTPVAVDTDLRFEQLSAGSSHTCGVVSTGEIYCWGWNRYGQLGTSTSELCGDDPDSHDPCSTAPVRVSGGGPWQEVSAGSQHTCALARDGSVHCWGFSDYGVLGDGAPPDSTRFRTEPLPVAGGRSYVTVTAGYQHSCAVSSEGPTYCWGVGELGDGSGVDSPVPVQVATEARFSLVTVGSEHTCGLSPGGVLYCWGSNENGQLGDGSHSMGWSTPVVVGR